MIKFIAISFLTICLSACSNHLSQTSIKAKYMNESSQVLELDGNRVHYRDEGPSDAEVVVLLHGTASSLHTWDDWTDQLKMHFRVIRMDLPGFGLTGPDAAARYEVVDDVKFLNLFLGALGINQAHLAGSSLGGRIAWQYALDHPQQVSSLTLLNALGYPQQSWPPAIEMGQWPIIDSIMSEISPRFMYEIGLKEVYFDGMMVTDAVVDRYYELSRISGNLKAFTQRVKARLDEDADQIKRIATPTLILWGEQDLYFPVENAYRFGKDIRGAQLEVFANVGHLPMEEVADESLDVFLRFAKNL